MKIKVTPDHQMDSLLRSILGRESKMATIKLWKKISDLFVEKCTRPEIKVAKIPKFKIELKVFK